MIIKTLKTKNRFPGVVIGPKDLVIRRIRLLALAMVLVWTLAGCQNPGFIWDLVLPTTSTAITAATGDTGTMSGAASGLTEVSSGNQTTQFDSSTTTTRETSPTSSRKELVLPDDQFDQQVVSLILSALRARQRTIVLDEVFATYRVDEPMVQAVIDAIFAVYDDVFSEHPEFFYMSGSFEVSYTLLQGSTTQGSGTTVSAMKLVPGYWPDTEKLTDGQLDELINQVSEEARQIGRAHV